MLWGNSLQNGNFSISGLFPNSKNYVLIDLKQELRKKRGDGVQCVELPPVGFLHFCQEPNINLLYMYFITLITQSTINWAR